MWLLRDEYDAYSLLQKVQMIMEDIVEVRSCLRDLDDKEAGLMRSVLMQKGDGRQDVMGLALALRATRLQHANKLPSYLRQQIAIERCNYGLLSRIKLVWLTRHQSWKYTHTYSCSLSPLATLSLGSASSVR